MRVTQHDGGILECEDDAFARGADGATHWTRDGQSLVKLYHQADAWRAASLDAILHRFNAVRGEPYWETLLCWPTAIVKEPTLGVVLPRAAQGLGKVGRFILPKWLNHHPEDCGTWRGRVGIAIRLARGVRRLHFKGLCHSDLSDNNVLANPHDGRALVIDCDGLVVPGIARAVVLGTDGLMAPELVAGTVREPTPFTDQHSLAVLIYQVLLLRHPLLGRRVHDANDPVRDELLAYGEKALFVEHPTDASNRPTRLSPVCATLGAEVNRLVGKAFVEGLHAPTLRPSAAEWERALVHLADTLVWCQAADCPMKAFSLPEGGAGAAGIECPWCGTRFRSFPLPVLRWCSPVPQQPGVYHCDGTYKVALPDDTLHQWHTRSDVSPGPGTDPKPLARFHRDARGARRCRWYLVNEALPLLEAADPGQPWKRIRAHEGVELLDNRKLRFGSHGTARDAIVRVLNPS